MSEPQTERRFEPAPPPPPDTLPPPVAAMSPRGATDRIEKLEAALRLIELEVYGRPEPYCRRIAESIIEVLGAPEP